MSIAALWPYPWEINFPKQQAPAVWGRSQDTLALPHAAKVNRPKLLDQRGGQNARSKGHINLLTVSLTMSADFWAQQERERRKMVPVYLYRSQWIEASFKHKQLQQFLKCFTQETWDQLDRVLEWNLLSKVVILWAWRLTQSMERLAKKPGPSEG